MRKILILIFLLAIFLLGIFMWTRKTADKQSDNTRTASEVVTHGVSQDEEFMIVPYWTQDSDISLAPSENLMYFGVAASEQGLDVSEAGYLGLSEFAKNSGNKKTYLIIRMLDNDSNFSVLEDVAVQEKVIQDSVILAKKYNFSGIVLDLEIQGIPFESFVESITNFNKRFADGVKKEDLMFGTFIYGDVYFRVRPFNMSEIGKVVDRVFIMAYDFSKAGGNPGPNFPLNGEAEYGYSFKQMINDFKSEIPAEKLTVVFGMFGYDWQVDEQGRGKGRADSKSTFAFQKFLTSCVSEDNCEIGVNDASEMKITYEDDLEQHVVWFETLESVEKKVKYLNEQGINSRGYWAYTYF